jgi:RHS repeat-associated protein
VTSNTAVSGHNGGTTQSVKYAAFGTVQSSTGSSPNRLKYTGREDDGNGLMYYRARSYDSVIGRFISEDPKGFSAGINFYAYVDNNPINLNDPSGLDAYVYVTPRADKCYNFRAFDNTSSVSGVFNVTTNNASSSVLPGAYTLSPRPHIEEKTGLGGLVQTFGSMINGNRTGNVNQHEGMPILSNTNQPNLISYPDGTQRTNITIHPGRDPVTGEGGNSLGCLVCNSPTFGRLNHMLQNNYDNGGSFLQMLPAGSNPFPSLKIPSSTPSFMGPIQPTPAFNMDTSLGSYGSAAGGGFLLYPNKINSNSMISVYSK